MAAVSRDVVRLDPPHVLDDVEDFLATDDLFVEYFNAYLALPSFPEPLCFNPETGGFEVVTGAREDVVKQIKAALRSQQRIPHIYHVVKKHAYSPIPIVPIVSPEGRKKLEIDTSFNVTTLNKEQGIHWVKAERLPNFLQSGLYSEYRLAHVLAQVKLTDRQGRFAMVKLDFTERPQKTKKADDEQKMDMKQVYMKQMYVCMGDTPTTGSDNWYSQARDATEGTTTTYVSLSHPVSTSRPFSAAAPRPVSASRPSPDSKLKSSTVDVPRRPASAFIRSPQARPDSGISSLASQEKNSVFSSPFFGSVDSVPFDDVIDQARHDVRIKSYTPRPSESVCITTKDDEFELLHIIYMDPKDDNLDNESGLGEGDVIETDVLDTPDTDQAQQYPDEKQVSRERGRKMVVKKNNRTETDLNVEAISEMIVGSVLVNVLSDLSGMGRSDQRLLNNPQLAPFLRHDKYASISFVSSESISDSDADKDLPPHHSNSPRDNTTEVAAACDNIQQSDLQNQEFDKNENQSGQRGKASDWENEVDSLLDSEEDYEENDREFFRHHKKWQQSPRLDTKKGIQHFKRFLYGTAGETLWHLWIDIDRLAFITSEEDQIQYLSRMREKYHKQGAQYEISSKMKDSLGLREPGHWTMKSLQGIQTRVAEPLVSYWALRFLLKELMKTNPAKYREYQEHRLSLLPPKEVCPDPPTMDLLPLRPKSCRPRIEQNQGVTVENMWQPATMQQPKATTEEELATRPNVGMKRVYGPPAVKLPDTSASTTTTTKSQSKSLQAPSATKLPHGPSFTGRPASATAFTARKKPRELLKAHLLALERRQQKQAKAALERGGSAMSACQNKPPTSIAKARPKSAGTRPSSHSSSDRLRHSSSVITDAWEHASTSSAESTKLGHSSAAAAVSSKGGRARPKTAPTVRKSSSFGSSDSVFEGGCRMEALLQALYYEKDSGHVFRAFLKKTGNKKWLNCAQFWEDVQEYRTLFYQDSIEPFVVKRHAQAIYSKYIVSGSYKNIGCSMAVRHSVSRHLTPPQEELFDQAEEEALGILYTAWMAGLSADMSTYQKVELLEVKRHVETKNQTVLSLLSGVIKEQRPLTPENDLPESDGYEDPKYDPALWEAVPEEYRGYTLEKLVHNRIELEHFRQLLAEKYADTDLKFWMDIEMWRRLSPAEEKKREQKAKDIKKTYLNKKYFFGPNSPAGKEGQDKVMQAGGGWGKLLDDRPPSSVLIEAQKYVQKRLEQKWLPVFLATEAFAERQKLKSSMDDVVDDVLVQKRRRSQLVWKD